MNTIVDRFDKIKSNLKKIENSQLIKIIAISKTFDLEHIKPLINYGHCHFGENKVQEALTKWKEIKKDKPNLKLHMVGKLQSNKAKNAFLLFEYLIYDLKLLQDISPLLELHISQII